MRLIAPLLLLLLVLASAPQERRPNVVLILTDDQGYGDLGCHGNPKIRTPHLDAFAKQSVGFSSFHVSPVCSPTRASLLTGRYNYRTGVVDTFIGRSLMHADEVTLAEALGSAGYKTGLFGKWHLGDNYPLRAMDQGFQETLTIRGGGIGQPSDPPGGDHYSDATMYRNGKAVRTKGYCSDVIMDGALEFIAARKDQPFLTWIALNAPHTPLEVPDSYLKPYLDAGLPDVTARVYAMVSNIDDNVGRLLAKLDELKLAENTLVIFMTDNGPQQARYNAELRGLKGTVFEGGIRVPFYLRWPAALKPGTVDRLAAHIDVLPTLLDACGVGKPAGVVLDGISLLPLLRDAKTDLPDRTVFFQWHRGDLPEKFRACAARTAQWKAIWTDPKKPPQLFDLHADPGEKTDLSAANVAMLDRLTREYEAWFHDMGMTRGYAPPRIKVGTPLEDPAVLTRQDWQGPNAGWAKDSEGVWLVDVPIEVRLDVTLRFRAPGRNASITYSCGKKSSTAEIAADATWIQFSNVLHPAGPTPLSAFISADQSRYGVQYVELKRVE